MPMRWRCPPENSCGYRRALAVRLTRSRSSRRAVRSRRLADPVRLERLGERFADGHAGVERRAGPGTRSAARGALRPQLRPRARGRDRRRRSGSCRRWGSTRMQHRRPWSCRSPTRRRARGSPGGDLEVDAVDGVTADLRRAAPFGREGLARSRTRVRVAVKAPCRGRALISLQPAMAWRGGPAVVRGGTAFMHFVDRRGHRGAKRQRGGSRGRRPAEDRPSACSRAPVELRDRTEQRLV